MTDYNELKRLAEAFPADLDWDGNTEPFFNGPSGESLGGGATGFYAVYGKPFRIEGDDYEYEGEVWVANCTKEFAKFMCSARAGVLSLFAEVERLRSAIGEPTANAWRIIDRKGKRFTVYHEGLAAAIAEMGLAVTPMCDIPPAGWECSREPGHSGPCAASEVHP